MNVSRTYTKAASIAWNAIQSVNRFLPERELPTPVWSDRPLQKRKDRWMPPLGPRVTQSVCPKCVVEARDGIVRGKGSVEDLTETLRVVDAEIVEEAGTVVMRKSCDRHGPVEDTLASDAKFFWRMEEFFSGADLPRKQTGDHGMHTVKYGRGSYVIVDLTTRCNMKCDTCFMDANQIGHVYEPSFEEIKAQLDYAASVEPKREFNILFSGGEPTLSPQFLPAIAYAKSIGLDRLHVATNGIKFAEDPSFAKDARAAGLHGVYLQCDGMSDDKNAHRRVGNYLDVKRLALENISAAGMSVTLQVTVVRGLNNDGIGQIVQFAAENIDKVFGVVFQPVMFTGRDEQITDERRYEARYTLSELAADLEVQSKAKWKPMRDWFPMACYGIFSTYLDMLDPSRERGSIFANGHPDSQIFSALVVNRQTGEWVPVGSFFNIETFLKDMEKIVSNAHRPTLSKAQMALAVIRNFDPAKAPVGLAVKDLFNLLEQCALRSNCQVDGWTSAVYGQDEWRMLIVGGMWFQDLFNYELHNIQMSTALVADLGLNRRQDAAEVSFSFKNAGGWRQLSERLRQAPSLSHWHSAHGRHPIYANDQLVPVGNIAPLQERLLPDHEHDPREEQGWIEELV